MPTYYFRFTDDTQKNIIVFNEQHNNCKYFSLSNNANTDFLKTYPLLEAKDTFIATSSLELAINVIGLDLKYNNLNHRSLSWWLHNHQYVIYENAMMHNYNLSDMLSYFNFYRRNEQWNDAANILATCALRIMTCGYYTPIIATFDDDGSKTFEGYSPKVLFSITVAATIAVFGCVYAARSDSFAELVQAGIKNASKSFSIA